MMQKKQDRVFPLFGTDSEEQELAQYKEMVEVVSSCRRVEDPMDFIAMGITPRDDSSQAAELVWKRFVLGATWWLELIAPYRFGIGLDQE